MTDGCSNPTNRPTKSAAKPEDRLCVVLVATQHPGNIGAAARAMKVMGLTTLRLVAPRHYPSDEATARASGADDLLARADVFDTLEEAVADCHWVAGTTARDRGQQWPQYYPRELAERSAERIIPQGQRVAVVFGRERTGLTNDELELCQAMIRIPSNPEYSSLNLGAAVQVVSYEMQLALFGDNAGQGGKVVDRGAEPVAELATELVTDQANQKQVQGMVDHLQQTLEHISYLDPEAPGYLMHRIRRHLDKLELAPEDINVVRGICKEILKGAY